MSRFKVCKAKQNCGVVVAITVSWMSLARSLHKTTVGINQWEGQGYMEYLVCCNLKLWNLASFFGLLGALYWKTSFHPEAYSTVMDHFYVGNYVIKSISYSTSVMTFTLPNGF